MMDTAKRVLVIDDEPDIRELLDLTLTRMGLDVTTVEDLGEARRAHAPKLVPNSNWSNERQSHIFVSCRMSSASDVDDTKVITYADNRLSFSASS